MCFQIIRAKFSHLPFLRQILQLLQSSRERHKIGPPVRAQPAAAFSQVLAEKVAKAQQGAEAQASRTGKWNRLKPKCHRGQFLGSHLVLLNSGLLSVTYLAPEPGERYRRKRESSWPEQSRIKSNLEWGM